MSDDEDLFTAAPTTADAEALVSKWLEDSDEESEEAYSTIVASSSTADAPLSRAVGVGLGAETLQDLLAQRKLDTTERKLKYRMEAAAKLKEQREKDALALIKKLEEDAIEHDSKTSQFSKKRQRAMSKASFQEQMTAPKKKQKTKEVASEDATTHIAVEQEHHETKEVVFDFSSSATAREPSREVKKSNETKNEKESRPDAHSHSSDKPSHKHKERDGEHRHKHKKSEHKHKHKS